MNTCANSGFRQRGLKSLTILDAHNVEVINALRPWRFYGEHDRILRFRQQFVIAMRKIASCADCAF